MRLMVSGALDADARGRLAALVGARIDKQLTPRTVEFACEPGLSSAARRAVAALCASRQLDHCFDDRNRKLSDVGVLAMDMDSTLITIECIDRLAARVGKSDEVSRITEATMRGEIKDFAASLVARVALLKGASASILEAVYEDDLRLTSGAEELLAAARGLRIKTVLVSGGFAYFAERLKQRLSLDYIHANDLEIVDGYLTGRVTGAIVDGAAKAAFVNNIAIQHATNQENILVIGDGANDVPMMKLAGTSIAFHAKPIVKSLATCSIDYGGLDLVLDWMGALHPVGPTGH